MDLTDFEKLRRNILQDLDLQRELQKIVGREAFISRLIEIGAERGLQFGGDDVSEAMRENRRAWIERWL